MEWTLEWMLPTPFPLHTFIQPPIVVEVRDRHPDADKLVYKGPNVAGGYPHPLTGELVTEEVRAARARHGAHSTGISLTNAALPDLALPSPPLLRPLFRTTSA